MSQPVKVVAVLAGFVDENGREMVLVGRRASGHEEGKLSMVTGHVEAHDDSLVVAAQRELMEEFSVCIEDVARFKQVARKVETFHKTFDITIFVIRLTQDEAENAAAADDMRDLQILPLDDLLVMDDEAFAYTQGKIYRDHGAFVFKASAQP